MKFTLKILKLISILLITVFVIFSSAAILLQDRVAGYILKSANNSISTPFDYGTLNLSFLKKFPKASIELRDVIVHSSPDFNSNVFPEINTDTLLAAKYVTIEFKITDIIKGIYNIDRVSARSGKINLYSDKNGHVNYDISVLNDRSGSKNFTIDLKRINLTGIEVYYNNLATELITTGLVKTGHFQSRISDDKIDFTAVAEMEIHRIQIHNIKITKPIPAKLDLSLQNSKNGILLRKGILNVQNYGFWLSGTISSENMLDLNLKGNNIDISKIRNYLPVEYLHFISEYSPTGILVIESRIKGLLTRTSNPHIEIECVLKNGNISYGKSDLSINTLSFAGTFSNGTKNRPETCSVSIKDLKAKLGSAEYSGAVSLSDFNHPKVLLDLKGKLVPGELREFFNLQTITKAEGFVDFNIKIEGFIPKKEKNTISDFFDLKPRAVLNFDNFNVGLKNYRSLITNVNGELLIDSSIRSNNFRFIYKGQTIKINGEFQNLPEWLAGRTVSLIAKSDVSLSKVTTELFAGFKFSSDTSILNKSYFSFPEDLVLDINFKIDSLKYKNFSSAKIVGSLSYKPGLLTFKSLRMETLNGIISGNGFVIQNKNKSMFARGGFNATDIDVNKAFKTFNNFGQSFLKAENIAGQLSGSLSVLIPMDSGFNPKIKLISAEGKYLLINGSLLNFGPVKQLSSFIELSELENISFEKMENDFFIRNNILYLPQMDVKSSAADLSINGKHSFDNDYEYHVKMLLSEFLSKKRNKNKVSEFGVVEDDGLGRTSLLLKIVNKGDNFKVGYDVKAAGNQVKNNIKSERKNLKSILNQEYGWFKNDSLAVQKPVEKKSRFRISWDEPDSAQTSSDSPYVKEPVSKKSWYKKK
jgi:hypothetical protein